MLFTFLLAKCRSSPRCTGPGPIGRKEPGKRRAAGRLFLEPLERRLCLSADLLVSGFFSNDVLRYDGSTGDFLDPFIPAGSGGLTNPDGLAVGPDGNLYVSSSGTNSILRYDGNSGEFLDAFVPSGSGGLITPHALAFGPDGNLYVSSRDGSDVHRYDGTTGAFIDEFVPAGSGGLSAAPGMTFGPDNNLYVSSRNTNSVLRYDGMTGEFLGAFVAPGSGGLSSTEGILFGSDGNLYVSSGSTDQVLCYDGQAGDFLGVFASGGGLGGPRGLIFGPDGNLYVSSTGNDSVLRYDGSTGAFIDSFVPPGSGGLMHPTYMIFQDINPAGPRSGRQPIPAHADAVALLLATPPERFAGAPGSADPGPTLERGHRPDEPTGPFGLRSLNNISWDPQQLSPASAGELHRTMVDRIFEGLESNLLPAEPWHTEGVLSDL